MWTRNVSAVHDRITGRVGIVPGKKGNDDFYLLGHILPSLLACIAALGESYPVERNRFPWHPRTVPPLLVGGSHCVLRSGANAYRCLVRRVVIPGPVVDGSQSSWNTSRKSVALLEVSRPQNSGEFCNTV